MLSAYEAERIEDTLEALLRLCPSPLPEMTRRMVEDCRQILQANAQPRVGQRRRELEEQIREQRGE